MKMQYYYYSACKYERACLLALLVHVFQCTLVTATVGTEVQPQWSNLPIKDEITYVPHYSTLYISKQYQQ